MSQRQICEEWLRNRTINPRTGREIRPNGPTYQALEQECRRFILLGSLREQCFNDADPLV